MLLSRSIYIAAILVVPIAASAQLKESAGAASTKPPAPRVAQTAPEHDGGHNQAVQQAADRLPLSPSIKALRNQEPPDPKGVERQLGLREPKGPKINLEGRNPSKQEILNAFHSK